MKQAIALTLLACCGCGPATEPKPTTGDKKAEVSADEDFDFLWARHTKKILDPNAVDFEDSFWWVSDAIIRKVIADASNKREAQYIPDLAKQNWANVRELAGVFPKGLKAIWGRQEGLLPCRVCALGGLGR
jgi:hypothetical protein